MCKSSTKKSIVYDPDYFCTYFFEQEGKQNCAEDETGCCAHCGEDAWEL